MNDINAATAFAAAVRLAAEQRYVDAEKEFIAIATEFAGGELADDALFNAGLCNYQINLFDKAIRLFESAIAQYPQATINPGSDEHGRTTAKCYYLLVNCYLGLDDIDMAGKQAGYLKNYNDSYIQTGGSQTTYAALAQKAIDTYLNLKKQHGQ